MIRVKYHVGVGSWNGNVSIKGHRRRVIDVDNSRRQKRLMILTDSQILIINCFILEIMPVRYY